MTLGLLKACSKGLVLKVMFIQFSAGERYTKQARNGEGEMTKEAPSAASFDRTGVADASSERESPRTDGAGTRSTTSAKNAKGAEPMGRLQRAFWRTAGLCILPHYKKKKNPAHKHNGTQ